MQARPVTIYVKNGAPIQGKFIKADNDSLEVEVENARRLTIGLDEVINVAFVAAPAAVSAAPTPDAADEGRSAAMAALKSLRGLDAAVEVGINRKDYANRLIDAKAAVKTMASPTRDVEIQRALDDYELALTFWDFFISLQRISDSIGRS